MMQSERDHLQEYCRSLPEAQVALITCVVCLFNAGCAANKHLLNLLF